MYPEPCEKPCNDVVACRPPTILERLVERQVRLKTELDDVERAIDALNSNPQVADIFNLVSRVSNRL